MAGVLAIAGAFQSKARLIAENLCLRQQLLVLKLRQKRAMSIENRHSTCFITEAVAKALPLIAGSDRSAPHRFARPLSFQRRMSSQNPRSGL
jgi:hypothetical protein